MSSRSLEINVSKISGAAEQSVSDRVTIEEPLEIRLGYSTADGRTTTSISITMRTPGHDAELATGRSLSQYNVGAQTRRKGDITLRTKITERVKQGKIAEPL